MNEQFQAWWQSISEREQQLTFLSAAFLLLAIIYWGAWQPLSNQLKKSQTELQRTQQTLVWVKDKASILVQAGAGKTNRGQQKSSLTQVVNTSAKQHGITFSRVVNKKEQIEVWISEVEFDRFVNWLTSINNQYGVIVINCDLSKTEKQGQIKINRLLLGY